MQYSIYPSGQSLEVERPKENLEGISEMLLGVEWIGVFGRGPRKPVGNLNAPGPISSRSGCGKREMNSDAHIRTLPVFRSRRKRRFEISEPAYRGRRIKL